MSSKKRFPNLSLPKLGPSPLAVRKTGAKPSIFTVIIVLALVAFELFNFSTNESVFHTFVGELTFLAIPWSVLMAFALSGLDFAGIARIFTPEQGKDEPALIKWLFVAWLFASAAGAMLTYMGIVVAMSKSGVLTNPVFEGSAMLKAMPIVTAVIIWIIRVALIVSFANIVDRAQAKQVVKLPTPVGMPIPAKSAQPATTAFRPGNGRVGMPPRPQPVNPKTSVYPSPTDNDIFGNGLPRPQTPPVGYRTPGNTNQGN